MHDLVRGFSTRRSTSTPKEVCTVHFGELREPLLAFIAHSEVLVGAVAWITDGRVLDALAGKQVALVVQKETWWKRTDARGAALARRYKALRGDLPASAFPPPVGDLAGIVLRPIACVGHGSGSQHQPLMHHKFLVRCTWNAERTELVPVAVWTGSFNFSANANDSFENAVVIREPTIAAAYLREFSLVASASERMNWRLSQPSPNPGRRKPTRPASAA